MAIGLQGDSLVSASLGGVFQYDLNHPTALGKLLADLPLDARSATISPDLSWLAVGTMGGETLLYDLRRSDLTPGPLQGRQGESLAVAFDASSRWLAISLPDGLLRIWSIYDKQFKEITGSEIVRLSSDGHWAATVSTGTLRLWNCQTSPPSESTLAIKGNRENVQLAFSPDNRWLAAVNDEDTGLWDLQMDDPLSHTIRLPGADFATSLAFDPESRNLAVACGLKTLVFPLADEHTPLSIESSTLTTDSIPAVTYTPEGRLLATSGLKIFEWNFDSATLISECLEAAGRRLSSEERQKYGLQGLQPLVDNPKLYFEAGPSSSGRQD